MIIKKLIDRNFDTSVLPADIKSAIDTLSEMTGGTMESDSQKVNVLDKTIFDSIVSVMPENSTVQALKNEIEAEEQKINNDGFNTTGIDEGTVINDYDYNPELIEFGNGGTIDSEIIGYVTTKPMVVSLKTGTSEIPREIPSETYAVIAITEQNNHTFYFTNQWYDESKRKPLVIADQMVEKYEPVKASLIKTAILNNFQSGSSLDFHENNIFVIGDDSRQILQLDKNFNEVGRISVFEAGERRIAKDVKADLETSTVVEIGGIPHILILGSGSRENRAVGFLLNTEMEVISDKFNYNIFVRRLKNSGISEVNLEGSAVIGKKFLLVNRGNKTNPDSFLVVTDNLFWEKQQTANIFLSRLQLPDKDAGVSEIYYDANSDILFLTATVEDTTNAYDDGKIGDSFIGFIRNISQKLGENTIATDGFLNLTKISPLFKGQKIEGICVEGKDDKYHIIDLVSDNDNDQSHIFKIKINTDEDFKAEDGIKTDSRPTIFDVVEEYRKEIDQSAPAAYYGFRGYTDRNLSEEQVKQELERYGLPYDSKYPVADSPDHPNNYMCRTLASSLSSKLRAAGYNARNIAGWYLQAGTGYYSEKTMLSSWKPQFLKEYRAEEHWWVECDGLYIDITSDQFYPYEPQRQEKHRILIGKKEDMIMVTHYPIRRTFLGTDGEMTNDLKELAEKMTTKLAKKKLDVDGIGGINQWIDKHAKISEQQRIDLKAQLENEAYSREKHTYAEIVKEITYADGGGVNLAPNGNPSNLTPEQYRLVRTPEFKAWFGDWEKLARVKINDPGIDDVTLEHFSKDVSKVLDENGEPRVMYHGTTRDFSVFERTTGEFGSGIYFGNKDDASYFANLSARHNQFSGQNIIPVFLNIKKPFIYRTISAKKPMPLRSGLIKKGYDGVFGYTLNDTLEVLAYHPEQIKSAISNRTFSSSPDILAADGDIIEGTRKESLLTKKDVKSGIVLLSKWVPRYSLYKHTGIISVEDGIPYVYDNDPDNPINEQGGSVMKTTLDEYLRTKQVIEFYDSGLTSEQIKEGVSKVWHKRFDWLSFNCETFIEELTGKPIKSNYLHPFQEIGISALIGATAFSLVAEDGLSLSDLEKDIKEKYGVTLDIQEKRNDIFISRIIVPKENRSSGIGTKVMSEITDFADRNKKRIILTPSTDFGATSVARLKDFYKKFGFVENKGRHKDFSIMESMYREPSFEKGASIEEEWISASKKQVNQGLKMPYEYTEEEFNKLLNEFQTQGASSSQKYTGKTDYRLVNHLDRIAYMSYGVPQWLYKKAFNDEDALFKLEYGYKLYHEVMLKAMEEKKLSNGGMAASGMSVREDFITLKDGTTYFIDKVPDSALHPITKKMSEHEAVRQGINLVFLKNFENDPDALDIAATEMGDTKQPTESQVRRAMILKIGYEGFWYSLKAGGESASDTLYSSSLSMDMEGPGGEDVEKVLIKKYNSDFKKILITEEEIREIKNKLVKFRKRGKKIRDEKVHSMMQFLVMAEARGKYDVSGGGTENYNEQFRERIINMIIDIADNENVIVEEAQLRIKQHQDHLDWMGDKDCIYMLDDKYMTPERCKEETRKEKEKARRLILIWGKLESDLLARMSRQAAADGAYLVEVIGKELEKDGGHKHRWVYEIKADNESDAEKIAQDNFNENWKLSDISFFSAKVITNPTDKDIVQKLGVKISADGTEVSIPVMDEEDYLSIHGASRQDIGESALHKNRGGASDKVWNRIIDAQAKKDHELIARRQKLREEYWVKVGKGELRPPTRIEKLISIAQGHPDNESVQAARRLLEKKGVSWEKAANGFAVKTYSKEDSHRLTPGNSIEKDILDKVRSQLGVFAGNFGWKQDDRINEGYLYLPDSFDYGLVKNVPLKQGEQIFRYITRTTAIGGIVPFIKINLERGLIYFPIFQAVFFMDGDDESIGFETRGIKAEWINLVIDKAENGRWHGGRYMEEGELVVITASTYYRGPGGGRYYYNKKLDKFISVFDIIHNPIKMDDDFLCSWRELDQAKIRAKEQELPYALNPDSVELTKIGVHAENGIDTAIDWQIKDKVKDKYFSMGMDGKYKWYESPDMGYTYSKEDAEKLSEQLKSSGHTNLEVVKYNKDWWKTEAADGKKTLVRYDGESTLEPGTVLKLGQYGQYKMEVIKDLGDKIEIKNITKNYISEPFTRLKSEYKGAILENKAADGIKVGTGVFQGKENWRVTDGVRTAVYPKDKYTEQQAREEFAKGKAEDGNEVAPSYAVKLSDLLNKYNPQLIGITRGMVAVSPSVAYIGGDLVNMFKGFGDSMDIKNIVYKSLKDENAHEYIFKMTNGKYKIVKPSWSDSFEDYYFDRVKASDGKETIEEKTNMESITIEWAEGENDGYARRFPKTYTSWEEANIDLTPGVKYGSYFSGEYNKAKFRVLFKNGDVFEGNLHLSEKADNPLKTKNVIGQHIYNYFSDVLLNDDDIEKRMVADHFLKTHDLGRIKADFKTSMLRDKNISKLEWLFDIGLESTPNGVPFTEDIHGPHGAAFVLYPLPIHNENDIKEAKQWIRDQKDVVSLKVAGDYEWDDVYKSAYFRDPRVRPLKWYQIEQDERLIRKERKKGTKPSEFVDKFVLPNIGKTEKEMLEKHGDDMYKMANGGGVEVVDEVSDEEAEKYGTVLKEWWDEYNDKYKSKIKYATYGIPDKVAVFEGKEQMSVPFFKMYGSNDHIKKAFDYIEKRNSIAKAIIDAGEAAEYPELVRSTEKFEVVAITPESYQDGYRAYENGGDLGAEQFYLVKAWDTDRDKLSGVKPEEFKREHRNLAVRKANELYYQNDYGIVEVEDENGNRIMTLNKYEAANGKDLDLIKKVESDGIVSGKFGDKTLSSVVYQYGEKMYQVITDHTKKDKKTILDITPDDMFVDEDDFMMANGGGFGYSAQSFQLTKEEFNYLLPVLKNKLRQSGDRYYFTSNNIDDLTDMLNRLKGLYDNYDELKNMVAYKCSMQGNLEPFRQSMGGESKSLPVYVSEDGTKYWTDKDEKGKWTVFSEGKWPKRNEFESGLASKEDAVTMAKILSGQQQEQEPEGFYMRNFAAKGKLIKRVAGGQTKASEWKKKNGIWVHPFYGATSLIDRGTPEEPFTGIHASEYATKMPDGMEMGFDADMGWLVAYKGRLISIVDLPKEVNVIPFKQMKGKAADGKDIDSIYKEANRRYGKTLSALGDDIEVELEAVPNPDFDRSSHEGTVKIKKHRVKVSSFEEARDKVVQFIHNNDLGSGNWSGGNLYQNGKKVGYVSYNGKVWNNDGTPKKDCHGTRIK